MKTKREKAKEWLNRPKKSWTVEEFKREILHKNKAMKNSIKAQGKKWYNHPKFPLIPQFQYKKGSEYSTSSFSFNWLFFTVWSLDSPAFELSIVCDGHWGIGIIGILPYLRWTATIPTSYRIDMWMHDNLTRKPKGYGK